MSGFTASNGVIVDHLVVDNEWTVDPLALRGTHVRLTASQMDALREFFQAKEDERLGRFRTGENPDYVAYDRGDGYCRVVREADGTSEVFLRQDVETIGGFIPARVARAFFDAHSEPKPWEADPRLGDVWAFTLRGGGKPILGVMRAKNGGEWRWAATDLPVDFDEVAEGRRIWPEVAS